MANFSINQVRHLYVVTSTDNEAATGNLGASTKAGDFIRFKYTSPGGLVGSDVIDVDKVMYAKYTPASRMRKSLKYAEIAFADGEAPIVGQEYIVRVAFRNYAGAGDDNMTFKYGMAVAKSTDKPTLLSELAISLAKNIKDIIPLAKIEIGVGGEDGDAVEVKATDSLKKLKDALAAASPVINFSDVDSIIISEVEQSWVLGTKPATVMSFSVNVLPVIKEGVETIWAAVGDGGFIEVKESSATGDQIGNGKTIADLEWFTLGARGDSYRYFSYPNTIPTTYVADATKEYDTIDIHYAYVGPNEGAQKSEKDITIAIPRLDNNSVNPVVGEVEEFFTTAGITLTKLPEAGAQA